MPVDSTEPEVASRSTLADLPEHPRSNEPWFQALPEAHRERLQREWRAGLEHDAQLVRRAGTDLAREAIEHATVFGFFDLCCVGQNAGSTVAAVVVGALAGAACKQLDAAQVLSAMIGGWSGMTPTAVAPSASIAGRAASSAVMVSSQNGHQSPRNSASTSGPRSSSSSDVQVRPVASASAKSGR